MQSVDQKLLRRCFIIFEERGEREEGVRFTHPPHDFAATMHHLPNLFTYCGGE